MDVNNEEVSDEDGCMSRRLMIKAIHTTMTERIWINCAASEVVFQLSTQNTGDPLHDESVIAVREEPNFHLRDVTDDSQHATLHAPFDGRDQGSHQREIAHEKCRKMPHRSTWRAQKRCTRQSCLRISACNQTSVTSPRCHTGMPCKSGITKGDSRIISTRVHRTVPRHPVVSKSNTESVEVGEDASELSRLRQPARSRRS